MSHIQSAYISIIKTQKENQLQIKEKFGNWKKKTLINQTSHFLLIKVIFFRKVGSPNLEIVPSKQRKINSQYFVSLSGIYIRVYSNTKEVGNQ